MIFRYLVLGKRMFSIRVRVQELLEEDLPRVLGLLILSFLEEKEVCIRTWGARGVKKGEFKYPYRVISLPPSEVVVVDTWNDRIQVFSSEGKFLRMWGRSGNKAGEFYWPQGISVLYTSPSRPGEVIVADTSNHRIQVFTSKGKFLRMWGKHGKGAGEFNHPYGVSVLRSSHEIAIADKLNHRIQIFTPEGQFLRMWEEEFKYPENIATLSYGSSDEIIVVDRFNHRIRIFTPEGKFLRMWGAKQGGAGKEAGEFNSPYDVAILPCGSYYEIAVVDTLNHRIQIFNTLLN